MTVIRKLVTGYANPEGLEQQRFQKSVHLSYHRSTSYVRIMVFGFLAIHTSSLIAIMLMHERCASLACL